MNVRLCYASQRNEKNEDLLQEALLHKPISKGLFHNIILR